MSVFRRASIRPVVLFSLVLALWLGALASPESAAQVDDMPTAAGSADAAMPAPIDDFSLDDVWQRYWPFIVAFSVLGAGLIALSLALLASNRRQRRLKRREKKMHQRLARILHGTRAGTWEWNVQTGETRFNERWAEIVGYRLEKLEPVSIDTWLGLAHPDDLERSEAALKRHFSGESDHYEVEARMRHRDGHWVWVHDSGRVLTRTDDGQPEWMFGTHMDVTSRRRAQEENEAWLTRFAELSANVPGALYQFRLRTDGTMHFPFVSEGIEAVYGLRPEDVVDDARPAFDVIHADDLEALRASIETSARSMAPWHLNFRVHHPRLGLRWISGSATPSRQDDGSVTWHGYLRDVTDFHDALERVRTAASVFEASNEGICITDGDLRFREVNQALQTLTGYSQEALEGQWPRMLLPPEQADATAAEIRADLAAHGHWKGEVAIRKKTGETFPAEASISPVLDDDGAVSHYVAMVSDITLRKLHERELNQIASLDALTGIGNRRQVMSQLDHVVSLARSSGTRYAICMMDLDGFKPVNDEHGHEVGDQLLTAIAQRLQNLIRAGDAVGRLGGDEFVLILHDPLGETVFERILDTVRQPIQIDETLVRVSASLGVTYCDADHAPDPSALLREADRAVYRSKSAGRDRFTVIPDSRRRA